MTSRLLLPLTVLALSTLSSAAAAAEDECRDALGRARSEAEAGKLVAAGRSVETCTKDACAADVRAECDRERTKIEEATPSTSFVVRDAQDRDLDALVLVDGAPIPLGRSVRLDPGLHDVSWSLADGAKGTRRITIVEGQRHRIVPLVAAERARPPAPAHPRRSAVPWIFFGAGGLLLTSAAVLELLAVNEDADSKQLVYHATRDDISGEQRAAFFDSAQDKYDAAVSNEAAAITCFALGTAAIAAGAAWLLFREGAATKDAPRVGLTPRGIGGTF